ncbi:SDR family NAD(P)-dependent oxidoreductase [Paenisporosarcina antarctica]|uniref:SDR family oxidoreductase n=1 Tax=Paenisporosarcina antarctica TaxID=417367 RepID=A0A4P6ZWR5_9BACL|nr:glucose 1-dehydrogenase [Paenisporosarcina antarctica]QBP39926.1 SDR family oxidoreductase [Paenisporosarcina antarctica]
MNQAQVVIVTGASQGIGRGIAEAYVAKGAQVIIADMNEELGTEVSDQLVRSVFIKTDVRKEEDVKRLMGQTIAKFGRIDILINNAGKSDFKPLFELSITEWDDLINTNLRSVFLCSREVALHMRKQDSGGAIVNISSTRATMSEPNSEAYAATKGGIIAITHALAASLAEHHITVNSISPGWIETGDYSELRDIDHVQHLSGRVGKPSDVAKACLYLTDPQNDFVTGIDLVVDGGMTHKMIYEH